MGPRDLSRAFAQVVTEWVWPRDTNGRPRASHEHRRRIPAGDDLPMLVPSRSASPDQTSSLTEHVTRNAVPAFSALATIETSSAFNRVWGSVVFTTRNPAIKW